MKRILTCTALAAVLLVAAPAFGQTYTEQIEQTIDKQNLDEIDVVSGVTVTLDGYKEAVNDALAKALA